MDEKRIILEEIRRINYILNYKLNETSVENKRHINERYGDGIGALRDLASTREGVALLRTEFEAAIQSGMELRTIGGVGKAEKLLKASDVIKAIKEKRIAEQSLLDLKGYIFQNSKNTSVIDAVAYDIVHSKEWERSFAHLSPKEIIARLGKTGLKVKPGSEQARSILNAHDAKLLKDAKDLKDAKELKTVEDLKNGKEFKDSKDLKDVEGPGGREGYRERGPMSEKQIENANKDFIRQNPKILEEVKTDPKSAWEKLKKSGLLIWTGTKWVLGNALWIILFGGLGYGLWQYFKNETGAEKENEGSSDYEPKPEPKITDSEGNVYNPCTGIYKIGCITKDGEGGVDYISKAQDCLGLSPTGMFNKQLENALVNKIHKRTFTKEDIKYICMAGGTLAQL
jgi:hypothetical protein